MEISKNLFRDFLSITNTGFLRHATLAALLPQKIFCLNVNREKLLVFRGS